METALNLQVSQKAKLSLQHPLSADAAEDMAS